jgi:thiol-disulfide isomerase/thioredoxin
MRFVLAAALAFFALSTPAAHDPRAFNAGSLAAVKHAHAGRPFVLSLWSVHCEPCRHEMALWNSLQRKHPTLRVVLVAADPPSDHERVKRFLQRYDPGPVESWWYADDFEERIRFSIDPKWRGELPRTYFFDAQHRVTARTGLPDAAWVEKWLAGAERAQ